MKYKSSLSYFLIFLLLAAVLLCTASCSLFNEPKLEEVDEPDTVETEPETEAPETMPPEPDVTLDGCLIIGDSRTEGLRRTGILREADFFCAVGISVFDAPVTEVVIDDCSYTLEGRLSAKIYDKVYIMLGINGMSSGIDEVAKEYANLLSLVRSYQPDAKIIIESNIHVTTLRSNYDEVYNNTNLDALNEMLRAMADGKTIFWLDVNPLLDDDMGGLRSDYSEEDGIHPNRNGDLVWGGWLVAQNENF